MKKRIHLTILFIVLLAGTISSQTFNKAKLDSFFNALEANNKAMGSLVLSKNGTVVYSRAIGYASISDKEKKPSTENTKYRIGSITKMFTATMIFQLAEQGKLSLTTTVDKYFPDLPNAKKISIENLLNHTSGLHNFTDDADYMNWMSQTKTRQEILAMIVKSKPDFAPGKTSAYSNTNYLILGYIIEDIHGKTYADVLKEGIVSMVGLSNTYAGGKTNIEKNESYSYQFSGTWKQMPETDMSIPGGAGVIVSTPADLVKFIEALFSGKLISVTSLAKMKTISNGYGMGIFEFPFYQKRSYGHNGGIDGFASTLTYFPKDSLAIAYCTNGKVYPMNDVIIGVLSIYYGMDYPIPAFSTISLKTEDLDKYLGVYSSKKIPLKITITKDGTTLMAQASGQSNFPLEATEKDKFKFDQAGVELDFNPEKNEFILKQGGGSYLFTKEK